MLAAPRITLAPSPFYTQTVPPHLCDALAASEGLELLVRLGHAIAAHDGLDGLREHLPGGIKVGLQGGAVQLQAVCVRACVYVCSDAG